MTEVLPGVAAALVDQEGRILLHYRKAERAWAPLSGAVEPGEMVSQAVLREIDEETALEAAVERLVGIYSDPAFQTVRRGAARVQFITCLFKCRVTGGELQGSCEGFSWRWFDADALPDDLAPYARVWLEDLVEGSAKVRFR